MNCRVARDYIQRELDDELGAVEQSRLAAHLEFCEACRRLQADFSAMRAKMGRMATTSGDSHRSDATLVFAGPRVVPWRPVFAAAAAIALCATTWWIVGNRAVQREPLAIVDRIGHEMPRTGDGQSGPAVADNRAVDRSPRPDVRVSVTSDRDIITMPVKTANPNVTIIWVYETVKTAKAGSEAEAEPSSSS